MFFLKSAMIMMIGILLSFLAFFIAIIFPLVIILLPIWVLSQIFIIISLARVYMDVKYTTLYELVEEPRPGETKWLYVYGDGEIVVTPAMKRMQMYSYSPELNQQIKEFKTYRMAGHAVKIVPEGVGHSVDLGACLYATHFKRKFGVRSIFDLRKLFRPQLDDLPEEKVTTVEKAHEALGLKPLPSSIDEQKLMKKEELLK